MRLVADDRVGAGVERARLVRVPELVEIRGILLRGLDSFGLETRGRQTSVRLPVPLHGGDAAQEEKILEAALEAGADDVVNEGGMSTVLCAGEHYHAVEEALKSAGLKAESSDLVMRPANRVAVPAEVEDTLRDLIEWLEELDDVHEIYHNAALTAPVEG